MTPNEQHLESIEREWGNFDTKQDDILDSLDTLMSNQRKLARLAEEQMHLAEEMQEQADEIRDAMREDGIGGY